MIKKQEIKNYVKVNDNTAHIILEVVDEVTLEKLLNDKQTMLNHVTDMQKNLDDLTKNEDKLLQEALTDIKEQMKAKKTELYETIKLTDKRIQDLDEVINKVKKLGIKVKEDSNVQKNPIKKSKKA